MPKEPKNRIKISISEDQLQVVETCKKMLKETGCDFMVSLFPCKDGSEEMMKASVTTENLAGHFNSVAEEIAKRLGITRERALISMAEAGSMTAGKIDLRQEEQNNDR